MKIIALNHHVKSITGGHAYNDKLYNYLSNISKCSILYEPDLNGRYRSWWKLFGPIAELKRLKDISEGDIVFFTDSGYVYHFLLLLICRLFKRSRNICILHHFPHLEMQGLKRIVIKTSMRYYFKLADTVIVPSPYTKNIAEKLLNNVCYIPLPFEKEYRPSVNYNEGDLLFVGAIEKRKGLNYLIKALKILKDRNVIFRLNILGAIKDDATYNNLKNDIASFELEDVVFFRGCVSEEEKLKYYNSSELFVFPSLLEGYGIVLVEAMRYGLPIICFNNSAMPFSIDNGVNGYLANNLDALDFANKIMKVLHNRRERLRLQVGIGKKLSMVKTEKDFENAVNLFYSRIVLR